MENIKFYETKLLSNGLQNNFSIIFINKTYICNTIFKQIKRNVFITTDLFFTKTINNGNHQVPKSSFKVVSVETI